MVRTVKKRDVRGVAPVPPAHGRVMPVQRIASPARRPLRRWKIRMAGLLAVPAALWPVRRLVDGEL